MQGLAPRLQYSSPSRPTQVDEVLKVLQEDLIKRGRLKADSNISRFDLVSIQCSQNVSRWDVSLK